MERAGTWDLCGDWPQDYWTGSGIWDEAMGGQGVASGSRRGRLELGLRSWGGDGTGPRQSYDLLTTHP